MKHKKSKTVGLVLLALILVSALGAKLYSNITMGDDEWIGLGSTAGRIVFDNQAPDEVSVMSADLGVGTLDPSFKLDVQSGVANNARFQTNYAGSFANVYVENAQNSKAFSLRVAGSNSSLGAGNFAIYDETNTAARLVIDQSGRVGINDTTPSYDLDVAGDIRATDDIFADDDITAEGEIRSDVQVSSDGNVFAYDSVFALYGDVDAIFGDVTADYGDVTAKRIFASDVVSSSGYVYAYGNMYGNADVYASYDIVSLYGDVTAGDDVVATGDVHATDVHATDDVLADANVHASGNVLAGDADCLAAKGSMPYAAAVSGSGGYFFYTADVSADTDLTGVYSAETQIRRQVWVRWLVYDVNAATTHYGEEVLEYLDVVVIADEGANDLELECLRGGPPNTEGYLQLDVVGNHTYEVTLMAMWQ
jgi:hypothetical protein